jgi:hypothetical protein
MSIDINYVPDTRRSIRARPLSKTLGEPHSHLSILHNICLVAHDFKGLYRIPALSLLFQVYHSEESKDSEFHLRTQTHHVKVFG